MTDRQPRAESPQTRLEQGFEKILTPFQLFVRNQTTSSLLLIIFTLAAMVVANSPLADDYRRILQLELGFFVADWSLVLDLKHWINEGLMTIFFFLLGMEIKREILVGDIREPRLLLPVFAAAFGGMLVPATIYYLINVGTPHAHGWGIPMATDTAFAIGVLTLLGKRVPAAAFTFLVALAIIDDLGAILVIALFYSGDINLVSLGICAILLGVLICFNRIGIRSPYVYLAVGFFMWVAMLESGVHSTVVGVLIAATVPARPKREAGWLVRKASRLIRRFEKIESAKSSSQPILADARQHALVESLQVAAEHASTPLRRWERELEYPVALLVLPIFAFANAGIELHWQSIEASQVGSVTAGVLCGLVLGKCIGIPLFTWLALRLGWGELPSGVELPHLLGLGCLGGIGFTMSMFISGLSFDADVAALASAKLGILLASLLAGCLGYAWLRFCSNR